MIKKALLFSLLLINGIYGCSGFQAREGLLKLAVTFPQKKFTLKVIPEGTSSIDVEVTGEGIPSTINFSLSATEPTNTIKVPAGIKKVKATAMNNIGKVLATATESVDVIANTTNKVRVKLQSVSSSTPEPVLVSPNPELTISPAPDQNISATPEPVITTPTPEPTFVPTPEPIIASTIAPTPEPVIITPTPEPTFVPTPEPVIATSAPLPGDTPSPSVP